MQRTALLDQATRAARVVLDQRTGHPFQGMAIVRQLVLPEECRSDAELVDAVRAGEPHAFEAIHSRHSTWVLRTARGFSCKRADVEDVAQETFLYLFRWIERDLALHSCCRVLLIPVIRGLVSATRRGQQRRDQVFDEQIAALKSTNVHVDGALPASLTTLLAGLGVTQRQLITSRFIVGISAQQIAIELGVPLGTVKDRLRRAILELRRHSLTFEPNLGQI